MDIASLATQALIYEVSCFPAPGLVTPVSTGAHADMDYYSFVDSACALGKHFALMAAAGLSGRPPREIFAAIRPMGKRAELTMYRKTDGVNTHKGAIFVLGLAVAAMAMVLSRGGKRGDLPGTVRAMAEGLVATDLDRAKLSLKNQPTHGELVYLRHDLPGVRAEAEAGFPIVFDIALPLYEACADLPRNDRLVHTLLEIMSHCEDTNVAHRHSPAVLAEVRSRAAAAMAAGGMRSPEGRAAVVAMEREFAERNISPGGSADLLGLTAFLALAGEGFGL
jgi:triphosphoribosyl-dephospho-CoA synthase